MLARIGDGPKFTHHHRHNTRGGCLQRHHVIVAAANQKARALIFVWLARSSGPGAVLGLLCSLGAAGAFLRAAAGFFSSDLEGLAKELAAGAVAIGFAAQTRLAQDYGDDLRTSMQAALALGNPRRAGDGRGGDLARALALAAGQLKVASEVMGSASAGPPEALPNLIAGRYLSGRSRLPPLRPGPRWWLRAGRGRGAWGAGNRGLGPAEARREAAS